MKKRLWDEIEVIGVGDWMHGYLMGIVSLRFVCYGDFRCRFYRNGPCIVRFFNYIGVLFVVMEVNFIEISTCRHDYNFDFDCRNTSNLF